MRQGYIDSQGNKYILTGVKAQFPRWTYAEWQAEGEPEIPWIRTDAPSGYRKVSGDDVSYDDTQSVNEKIDKLSEKAIGSISKYSQISGGALDRNSLVKVGNTVFGSARLYNIDITSLGYFFEIPTGYRPKTNQYVMAYIVANSTFIPIQAEIRSDGLVYIAYSQGVNTTQVGFAGSWTTV